MSIELSCRYQQFTFEWFPYLTISDNIHNVDNVINTHWQYVLMVQVVIFVTPDKVLSIIMGYHTICINLTL